MNTPSPLVPQGTFADKGKSQLHLTFYAILAIHMVFLGLLLIAGCNRKPVDQAQDGGAPPAIPSAADPAWPGASTSVPPVAVTPPDPGAVPSGVVPPGVVSVPTGAQPINPNPVNSLPPALTEPTAGAIVEHTIAKGESFYTLGKKYGVGFKAIAEANPGVNPI